MNLTVIIDWKLVVALGVATSTIIFATKMDADAAERVFVQMADTCE